MPTNLTNLGTDQTIGVEIEFCNMTRAKAATTLARFFRTSASYVRGRYDAYEVKDTDGRTWKIMRDRSISGPDSEQCELVTPILRYTDIDTLQEIVRTLRRAGAISDADHTCGVHVHIGAYDHTAQTLRTLTNIMAAHEELLAASLHIDDFRMGQFCKKVDQKFLERVNKEKPRTLQHFQRIWYEDDPGRSNYHYDKSRYHLLNLHAVFSKGTVEFRAFNFTKENGIHAGELKAWIYLCMAVSTAAKTLRTASPKEAQTANPKYAMRCWLLRLGFIGPEFETARLHLCKHLDGDAAFRNGRETA